MRKIDHWVGKHLFVPLVIRFCQLTGLSQHAVHNWGWLIAGVWWFGFGYDEHPWLLTVIAGLCCFVWVVIVAVVPNLTSTPQRWLRYAFLIMVILNIAMVLVWGWFVATGVEITFPTKIRDGYFIIALFAEYAATIKTIPPKETKEKAGKLARQEAR